MAETKYYLDEEGLDKLVELVLERINKVQEGLTDGSVTKVGTTTVGSGSNPTYLDKGVPKASTSTVGGEKFPVYLENGELKQTEFVSELSEDVSKAQSTVDDLSTEFYNESVRPNVIRNTNDINELGSTGTWDAGTWRKINQSGSTRTSTRIDVDDAPDPHISCGVRCYTESGTTYAKIRQDGVPMEEGAYYTASFYARGSGQAQFQYGMSPYVATNFDVTDDWERYSVGFTFIGADCASTDGSTYIYFGTGSAATVEICGMMLEKWDEMTDWMPNPLDAKDTTAREEAESAQSIAQEASDEISDLKDMSISTSNGSAVSATFGFETIGIPRTLNDDGSYKSAFDTIKDYWEQLETRKVYIAFVNPQQQYVAIIQKYTGDHNYGSVFIQGYGFSTPRYYQINNGTWYEVTLADNASLTDGSVTKVGTSTVGGAAKPIYLSSGTPTACSLYPTSTFSLSTGSWSSNVSGDYNYRYQLSNSSVTADTIALAFLDTSCASVAGDAGMCSVVESSSGTLTFRAVDKPSAAITGSVVLLNT